MVENRVHLERTRPKRKAAAQAQDKLPARLRSFIRGEDAAAQSNDTKQAENEFKQQTLKAFLSAALSFTIPKSDKGISFCDCRAAADEVVTSSIHRFQRDSERTLPWSCQNDTKRRATLPLYMRV